MADDTFVPYIPPEKKLVEFTFRALLVGCIITVIMGAANTYLGLKVGLTVSASIPATVIALAIFKALKSNILEITVAKTTGAAGESLAAGIIFTLPALILVGAWEQIDVVAVTAIALVGGTLGVLFTISLRRILIEDLALPFPEGVAAKEILIASEKGGSSAKIVFTALGIGALFKVGASLVIESGGNAKEYALGLWTDRVQGVLNAGRLKLYGGADLSVALLGVGYIVGLEICKLIFIGGFIGWVILAPIFILVEGVPLDPSGVPYTDWQMFDAIRQSQLIFIGVGAMIVGSIHTLFTLRHAIVTGVKNAIKPTKAEEGVEIPRTQQDLPLKWSYIGAGLLIFPMFGIYYWLSGSILISAVCAVIMVFLAFLFTTIAGYLAGIVGSSNNPVSGITIATLLFTSVLIFALGGRDVYGMAVALVVGAIVCISAAIAGDVVQSLKTGQLLGSTPKYLQMGEFVGVIAAAFIIPPVLLLLDTVYGIGSPNLPAPQAQAMKAIVEGIFIGGMNWPMVALGMQFAVLLIIIKKPVLPIAIGLYLPFSLSIPILVGGYASHLVNKRFDIFYKGSAEAVDKSDSLIEALREKIHTKAILYSSGLIAGEALMGVAVAALVTMDISLALIDGPIWILGMIFFGIMAWKLWQLGTQEVDALVEGGSE